MLVQNSDCLFVVPANCVEKARRLGIPEERIQVAVPREAFEVRGIQVLPMRALHGHLKFSVYSKANLQDCGYLM